MRSTMFVVAVAMAILNIGAPVSPARASQCPDIGVYSTLGFDPETGDFSGTEVTVMLTTEGFTVVYVQANGAPPEPPKVANATVSGDSLLFTIGEGNGESVSFHFNISCKGLDGYYQYSDSDPKERVNLQLPRTKSFWDNSLGSPEKRG